MEAIRSNRRLVLIGLIVLLLVCLVGVLVFNVFFGGVGDNVAGGGDAPAATATPAQEESDDEVSDEEAPTPTSSPVVSDETEEEEAMSEADEADEDADADAAAAAPSPTATPDPTDTPTPASAQSSAGDMQVVMIEVSETGNVLENGDFEAGFDENGVGLNWRPFKTDAVDINFTPESADPFLLGGDQAQRISIDNGYQPDRYGGIYQTVAVEPGATYTLTLNGQIRSGFGSELSSSYGYRLQYAIDQRGGQNWLSVPQTDWIELPWPEQSLNVANVSFSSFTTQIVPTDDSLTLYIRGWNKWPDSSLAEYTLDSLSLVGPVPGSTEMIAQTISAGTEPAPAASSSTGATAADSTSATAAGSDEEAMIDQPLPVTGSINAVSLLADGRFWLGAIVLVLLATGAVTRSRW